MGPASILPTMPTRYPISLRHNGSVSDTLLHVMTGVIEIGVAVDRIHAAIHLHRVGPHTGEAVNALVKHIPSAAR